MDPIIIAHGGAGNEKKDNSEEILESAVETGIEAAKNGNSVDAAESVVNHLEDEPVFNAGKGAKLQMDGVARLEAAIMDSQMNCGAVTGLEKVPHAVSVAREVMEKTHHIMLGNGFATEFAENMGYATEDIRTETNIESWEEIQEEVENKDFSETIDHLKEKDSGGTVGCVVLASDGSLAAATSTGGRSPQLAGRIGDSPLIGNGTYCNQNTAVSATGIGEAIIRTTLARRTSEKIMNGKKPQVSAEEAIKFLEEVTGKHAGIIALDSKGSTGIYHNADSMPVHIKRI